MGMSYMKLASLTLRHILLNILIVAGIYLVFMLLAQEFILPIDYLSKFFIFICYNLCLLTIQLLINVVIVRYYSNARAQWTGVITSTIILSVVQVILFVDNEYNLVKRGFDFDILWIFEYAFYSIFGFMIAGYIIMRKVRMIDTTFENEDILDL